MFEERMAALEARVTELEYQRTRARTWAEVISELDMLVADVQVTDINNALMALVREQRGE
jgi:hypothetical protein